MTQRPIDLLPASMRAKSEAQASARRNATIAMLAGATLLLLGTHARLTLLHAKAELHSATKRMSALQAVESEAEKLNARITEYKSRIDRYRRVETPIPVTRLLAALVHEMPASVTLDRLDLQIDRIARSRRTRTAGQNQTAEIPARRLTAELAGFAGDDLDIAEFVARLDHKVPFDEVSLDFSRQRRVRGRSAREFRLSFSVDLDAVYLIRDQTDEGRSPQATREGEASREDDAARDDKEAVGDPNRPAPRLGSPINVD